MVWLIFTENHYVYRTENSMARVEAEKYLGGNVYNPGERWCGERSCGSNGKQEKWWDSGHISMEKLVRFANGLDVGYERTTHIQWKIEAPFNEISKIIGEVYLEGGWIKSLVVFN